MSKHIIDDIRFDLLFNKWTQEAKLLKENSLKEGTLNRCFRQQSQAMARVLERCANELKNEEI